MTITLSQLQRVLSTLGVGDWEFRLVNSSVQPLMEEIGCTYIGKGKDRFTYLTPNKKHVLKIPHHRNGLHANEREAWTWKQYVRGTYLFKTEDRSETLAPCRLICNAICLMPAMLRLYGCTDGCDDARVILQQSDYVEDNYDYYTPPEFPKWARNNNVVDCVQVGIMRNGKIVIYDYGD